MVGGSCRVYGSQQKCVRLGPIQRKRAHWKGVPQRPLTNTERKWGGSHAMENASYNKFKGAAAAPSFALFAHGCAEGVKTLLFYGRQGRRQHSIRATGVPPMATAMVGVVVALIYGDAAAANDQRSPVRWIMISRRLAAQAIHNHGPVDARPRPRRSAIKRLGLRRDVASPLQVA